MDTRIEKLTVPCNLGYYCADNRLINELKLLCCLKLVHNNYFLMESMDFKQVSELFGRRDKRTLKKYLDSLIELNWIGYDETTSGVHIRGWQRILADKAIKNKKYAQVESSYFQYFDAFLLSIIVDKLVKGFRHYFEKVSKRKMYRLVRKSAKQEDEAIPASITGPITYYGVSNERLAKIFKKSKAWASFTKKRAEMAGILFVKKQFCDFDGYAKEPGIILNLKKAYPEVAHRLRIIDDPSNEDMLILRMQLHDELCSKLIFTYRAKN